jgi:elongation factor P
MSRTDELHRGMVIRHEGHLYTVEDYRIARTGKQKPTVHVKLRSLASGKPVDRTLDELGKIEEVPHEIRRMQYLYAAGKEHVFMDTESYEQYSLGEDLLGGALDLLAEEESYRFQTIEGKIVALQLPDIVDLQVADTAPVEHAGGSTNVHKDAKLASGLVVQVPLFIKTGDKIRVNTDTHQYEGKEHA